MRVQFLGIAVIYRQPGFIYGGNGAIYRGNAAIFSASLPVFARYMDFRRAKTGNGTHIWFTESTYVYENAYFYA